MLLDPHHQAQFDTLINGLGKDTSEFYQNPLPHLGQSGIPLVPAASLPPEAQFAVDAAMAGVSVGAHLAASASVGAAAEKVTVTTHWWGIDIVMNEKMTQDIITGVAASGPVGGAIAAAFGAAGVVTGGVATAIGAGVGAIVTLKVAQIKITDNGKGVHWPVSWPQWAALLAALPTGPAGIAAAGVVFFHPVRN